MFMRTGIFALVGATLLAGAAGVAAGSPLAASATTSNNTTGNTTATAQSFRAFGGPFRHGFNENGQNWSGYAATGSGFSSVSATWAQPAVTCDSRNDLYAPWVGIDGLGSSSVEQAGVQTDCSSGSPVNSPWYEMYPKSPVYWHDTVLAGDVITATVTRGGTNYTLRLTDQTRGWTEQITQSYRGRNASAEIILESPSAAYPDFGTVSFDNVTIDGAPLSSSDPVALDASSRAGFEDHTSAIGSDGDSFSVSYQQE